METQLETRPFVEFATDDRKSLLQLAPRPPDERSGAGFELEAELRTPGFVGRQPVWLEPEEAFALADGVEKLRSGALTRLELPRVAGRALELTVEATSGMFEVRASLKSQAGLEPAAVLAGSFMVKRHGLTAFGRQVERMRAALTGTWPRAIFRGDGCEVVLSATGEWETIEASLRIAVDVWLDGDRSRGYVMSGSQVTWVYPDELERLADVLEGGSTEKVSVFGMSSEEFSLEFSPPWMMTVSVGALSLRSGPRVQREVTGVFQLDMDLEEACEGLRAMAQLPRRGR